MLEPLVRSLRMTGSRAEFVIFIDVFSDGLTELAKKYGGIRFMLFDKKEDPQLFEQVYLFRFFLYEKFLSTQDTILYRYILHIDSIDAYFQSDPFVLMNNVRPGLVIAMENTAFDIKSCKFHRTWIGTCTNVGGELLQALHSYPRVCMGVVMGTLHHFHDFLRLLIPNTLSPNLCNDQGLLNILLWRGVLAEYMPVTVFSNVDGPIFHGNTDYSYR